jgi:hypothetical protein
MKEWHELHNYTHFARVLFTTHHQKYIECHNAASKLYSSRNPSKPALDKFHYFTEFNTTIDMKILSYMWLDLGQSILYEYTRDLEEQRYGSTGMLAILIAATTCDHVTLYGFGRDATGQYEHYFSKKKGEKEWQMHEYSAEKAFFADLERGHGKYEKHLRQYDIGSVTIRK